MVVYECLVKALVIMMIDKAPNNGINPLQYLPKSFQDFWKSWKVVWMVSGSVWRISLECEVDALVNQYYARSYQQQKDCYIN